MSFLLNVILIILGLLILWQIVMRILKRFFHFPAPPFLGFILDSRFRRLFQPPERVLRRSGVREGM